jgi:hypothetical protein
MPIALYRRHVGFMIQACGQMWDLVHLSLLLGEWLVALYAIQLLSIGCIMFCAA